MTKSSEINVILKTPAQKTEDQTIKCYLDWTVNKLKNYISENYPLKPSVSDQRLIYSGHLLNDDKTLQEIFQPSEDEENLTFTVHLVLNQKELNENKEENQSTNNELNTSTNQSIPNLPNITQFSFNLTNDSSIDLTNLYLQQMQQYQQMYVNYMAQYYLNTNNNDQTVLPFMINPMLFNPFLMPNLTNLNTIINLSTTNDTTTTNQTTNETERVNQENQEINDDLDMQNNWSDIFWNLLILFSLASASLSRTLFVLVVSFIYYLYKAGFFSFIRIRLVNLSRNVNNQNHNNLNRNEDQLQQMMDNLETPDSRNRRTDNETENENTDNQQQSYLLDKFRFIFMIISSLFSSLMPNDINVPAN